MLLDSGHIQESTAEHVNRRRAKKHGFRARMRTRAGRDVVRSRRSKGRQKLTA